MRYTRMPNIKFLSLIMQKLWPTLKFFSRRTDRLTHILTDGQFNFYVQPYRGHKKLQTTTKIFEKLTYFISLKCQSKKI